MVGAKTCAIVAHWDTHLGGDGARRTPACRPGCPGDLGEDRSSTGVVRGARAPLSNASRASATASSTSASVASGTRPMTCSVVGLITSMVPVPEGLTHSPPMTGRRPSRSPP